MLEARFDALQEEVGVIKRDLQKDIAMLLEKFEVMMKNWDIQERDTKEKGNSPDLTEPAMSSDARLKTQEMGGVVEGRGHREEIEKWENRSHRLEMPLFNGEDPDGWIFRVEIYFNMNYFTN